MSVIKWIVCVTSFVMALLLFSDDLLAVQLPAAVYKQLIPTHQYVYHKHRTGADHSMVTSGRHQPIRSVSPMSQVKQAPTLLVESRLARRKVIIAAIISMMLAWVLFRLVSG